MTSTLQFMLLGKAGTETQNARVALVLLDLQFDYGPPSPYTGRPSHTDPFFGLRILQQLANKWPDPRDEAKTAIPVVTLSTKPRAELEAELTISGISSTWSEIHRNFPERASIPIG